MDETEDPVTLTETNGTRPRPRELDRDERNRHGRPTHTSINVQTKVSEANPSLRIR